MMNNVVEKNRKDLLHTIEWVMTTIIMFSKEWKDEFKKEPALLDFFNFMSRMADDVLKDVEDHEEEINKPKS